MGDSSAYNTSIDTLKNKLNSIIDFISPHKKKLLFITILQMITTIYFAFRITNLTSLGFPLDDPWIHAIYARNFANHNQIAYNVGQTEVGTTSILWTLVLGMFMKTGIDPIVLSYSISTIFAIALSFLVYFFCLKLTGHNTMSFIAGCLIAIEPNLCVAKVSGMEIIMFSFLALFSVYMFYKQKYLLCGFAMGLTILARPEGYIIAAIIMGTFLLQKKFIFMNKKESILKCVKSLFKLMVPVIILVLPWVFFTISVSGNPLPNPFYAKGGGYTNSKFIFSFPRTYRVFYDFLTFIYPTFYLLGAVIFFRNKKYDSLPLVITPVFMIWALNLTTGAYVRAFIVNRYWIPIVPFMVILGFYGVVQILNNESYEINVRKRFARKFSVPKVSIILLGLGLSALMIFFLVKYDIIHITSPTRYREIILGSIILFFIALVLFVLIKIKFGGLNYSNRKHNKYIAWVIILCILLNSLFFSVIYAELNAVDVRDINDMHVYLGKWVDKNVPENSTVALNDAGAIKYFGNREVLDIMGLNSNEMLLYKRLGEVETFEYLKVVKPDILIIFPDWFPSMSKASVLSEVNRIEIEEYKVLDIYPSVESNQIMVVYECNWNLSPANPITERNETQLDSLDVGNYEQERDHNIKIMGETAKGIGVLNTTQGSIITDGFRNFTGGIEFSMNAIPNKNATILFRYQSSIPISLNVIVNNLNVGIWNISSTRSLFMESKFNIPNHYVTDDDITIELKPDTDLSLSNVWLYEEVT
jgi:hypothetical protein